jgi:hypothetical protein
MVRQEVALNGLQVIGGMMLGFLFVLAMYWAPAIMAWYLEGR